MKKIISLLLSVFMLLSMIAGVNISAVALTYNDYEYSLYGNESAEITAYKGNETNLIIPDEIDGLTVKSIGARAFENCNRLISVTIPLSVKYINWFAFNGCSNLKNLVIQEGVIEIGRGAFDHCSSLERVVIPNSVTIIDINAFANCSKLKSINIPQNVEMIGYYAFQNCKSLTNISVDKNNRYYDSRNNCNAVIETDSDILILGCKNTVIPNNVTEIGEGAFDGCSGLESISIPNNVTAIGDYAFEGCSGLKSITLSENTTIIGFSAFDWCTSLVGVTIPISVEFIDTSAFDHCDSLEYIVILNENCYIDYDEYTIIDTADIYGYTDSSANEYAENYNRIFMPLEEVIPAVNMPEPKHIVVSNITATGATITFDAIGGASGYEIQYLLEGEWKTIGETTKNSRIFSQLGPNRKYTMRIRTISMVNGKKIYSKNWSSNIDFKTLVNAESIPAVENLMVSNINTAGGTLTFDAVEEASGYEIQYLLGTEWKTIGETTNNSRTFSQLDSDREYRMRVRAIATVNGEKIYSDNWSETIIFKTLSIAESIPAVKNLMVSNINAAGGTLTFDAVEGASGYEIQYLLGTEWKTIGETTNNSRTFSQLGSDREYRMRVRAIATVNGEKIYSDNWSETIIFKTLSIAESIPAVENLIVSNINAAGGTLTFDAVEGAAGYELQYMSNGVWKSFGEITATLRVFSSLAPDTKYQFRVRAYMVIDGINVYSTNWSAVVSFTTEPDLPAVENIRFNNITSNGFTIVFDSVAGADGYEIQYLSSGDWVKISDITTNSRMFSSLESGRTYSFRVRAYQIINGNIVYSSNFSEVYSCTTL